MAFGKRKKNAKYISNKILRDIQMFKINNDLQRTRIGFSLNKYRD